jgi:transcriptional regulator
MPRTTDFPPGTLAMLLLRVLRTNSMHGYAIAQRIRQLSGDVLQVEEGSLYPALQRLLLKGWVTSEWGTSDTGRRVRFYRLTKSGKKQLEVEVAQHDLVMGAIQTVLRTA